MPMFVQAKQLNVQGKRNEGTLKETEFPHKSERSPGQSPVETNYMQKPLVGQVTG